MMGHRFRDTGRGIRKAYSLRAAFNLAALFVIGVMIVAPLEPAFAQSASGTATGTSSDGSSSSGSSSVSTPATDSGSSSNSSVSSQSGSTPTTGTSGQSTSAGTGSTPATPTTAPTSNVTPSNNHASPAFTPGAGGAGTGPDIQPAVYNSFNQNQLAIDKNTGALESTYPISVPPGRNGLQPDLDLVYNSQNSQPGSIFGEGWSIGIPYIERLNKSGVENLYSTSTLNYFTSSLDGELVTTSTATSTGVTYVARTENGTFSQYTFSSSSDDWTMTDKKGTQYVFGSTSDSQESSLTNATNTFKWMLKTVTDTNGNSILYTYFNDSGQIYPSSTVYTNTSSTTGIFSVNFLRASSTDNATSTATGFAVNSNYRVSEIDVNVSSTWVRKYVLNYTTGDNGYTTLLHSITESGENASGTVVSEPTSTFTYQTQTPGWTSSSTWNPPVPFVSNGGGDNGYRLADLTGNGLEDIISSSSAYLNSTSSWVSSSTWDAPISFTTSTGSGDSGYRVVDVNNNGLDDIISCNGSYVNTGSGWASSSSWNSPICFANNGVPTGAILADVNGDGLPAILSGYTNASGTNVYAAYVDTGNGWATSTVWTPPLPFVSASGTDMGVRLVDVTGDGLPDILSGYENASGTNVYAAYMNTGNGWATSTVWTLPLPFVSNAGWDNGVRIADVNGDGLPSLLYEPTITGSKVFQVNTLSGGSLTNGLVSYYPMEGNSNDYYGLKNGSDTAMTYGTSCGKVNNGACLNGSSGWINSTSTQNGATSLSFWVKLNSDPALSTSQGYNLVMIGNPGNYTDQGVAYGNYGGTKVISFYGQSQNVNDYWANDSITMGTTNWYHLVYTYDGTTIKGYVNGSLVANTTWTTTGIGGSIPNFSIGNPNTQTYNALYLNSDIDEVGVWNRALTQNEITDLYNAGNGQTMTAGTSTAIAYLGTGNGWATSTAWTPPTPFDTNGGYDAGTRITDTLADGLPDIIQGYTNASSTNVYAAWTNNNSIRADILTGVSYPQGGSASIAYAPASQFMNASGVPVNVEPYPVYVVSKITNNDDFGNLSSSTYQYASGTYYYGSPTDHEFAGFGLVTQTDPAGNVTKTYYNTSNGTNGGEGQYIDNFWKIGKAYRVENYDNAGNLYKVTITKWDSASIGGNASFVFPDQTLEMDYDGLSTHEDSAESYTWNTANGNETQKIQWGQVTGSNNGTFTPLTSGPKVFQVNTLSGGTLTNGLVAYYPMEGNSNDYYESNNGTDNAMAYGTAYGKVDQGAGFNGSTSNIDLGKPSILRSSAITINEWVDPTSTVIGGDGYASTIFGECSTAANNWSIKLENGGKLGWYANCSADIDPGSHTLSANTWYMLTLTDSSGTINAYVNGASDGSTSGGSLDMGMPLNDIQIGKEVLTRFFPENIDEVGVWNRALTANEISDLYNGGAGQTMAVSPAGSNEYITNISYASSTGSTVTGKVSDETMLNGSSTKLQETRYYYDGLALGNIGTGNLTTQDDWIAGSTYATTTRDAYNSYGLVTQTLDPRNNTTTYAYDAYNLYPATTTNALGQATGYHYDYSTGKPTQTIDPNGLKFQTTYDGLGRPLQVFQPDQVTTSTEDLKTAYAYTDTSGSVSVEESDYMNASTSVNTYGYYDGLNRLIQTRKSATDVGTYKVTDQSYDSLGLTAKESLPYFGSGASSTVATTTAALFTTYTYDPLGRVLTTMNSVGTTTDSYDNWEMKITDPNGNEKDEYHDAYGNLVQVGEHNGTSTYTTTYTYDGLQDLLGITDANGNVRNFAYDGLGREVSSTDLRGPASSTFGIWNYTYDTAGNLTKRVDPKSQTVTYAYDALNRVSTESEASTTQTAYTYDTCTNGVGRLCSVSSTDAVSLDTKTYDPEGNLASETKKINGTNYGTTYTYDRQGNQLTITNPDGSEVEYAYGTGGLATNVQEKESGGSFANIVSSIDYSPMDKVATQSDANGVATVNTYNSAALYRLNSIVTTNGSSTAIQSSTYTYDNDGNITKSLDNSATNGAITVNYTYDGLNRLLTASSSGAASGGNYLETFTYDPVGNILTGPAGTYTYNGGSAYTDPDAVTKITNGTSTTNFTYDNNGNLTNASSGFTYTWDYNNRLLSAYGAGATSTYGYDYTGERASVTNGTSTTYYPETTYNANGTSTITKTIYANGELVATVQNGTSTTVSYVSDDYLGGTNAVSNSSGALVENVSYLPYGQIRIDNEAGANVPQKYIGAPLDSPTQLSYLQARYYSGVQGQFLSEDPVFQAFGTPKVNQFVNGHLSKLLVDPQVLNPYSYASDNPINNEDPSGLLTSSQAKIAQQIVTLIQEEINLVNQEIRTSSGGGGGGGGGGSTPTVGLGSQQSSSGAMNEQPAGGAGYETGEYQSTQSGINTSQAYSIGSGETPSNGNSSPSLGQRMKLVASGVVGTAADVLGDYATFGDIDNSADTIAAGLLVVGVPDPVTTIPTIGAVGLITTLEVSFYAANAGSLLLDKIQADINK